MFGISGLDDFAPMSPSVGLLQPLKFDASASGKSHLLGKLIAMKSFDKFPGLTPQRTSNVKVVEEVTAKPRGLEDLDVLGEALMKQNLPTSAKHQSSFQKSVERVPLNELARKKMQNEGNTVAESQVSGSSIRMSYLRPC